MNFEFQSSALIIFFRNELLKANPLFDGIIFEDGSDLPDFPGSHFGKPNFDEIENSIALRSFSECIQGKTCKFCGSFLFTDLFLPKNRGYELKNEAQYNELNHVG